MDVDNWNVGCLVNSTQHYTLLYYYYSSIPNCSLTAPNWAGMNTQSSRLILWNTCKGDEPSWLTNLHFPRRYPISSATWIDLQPLKKTNSESEFRENPANCAVWPRWLGGRNEPVFPSLTNHLFCCEFAPVSCICDASSALLVSTAVQVLGCIQTRVACRVLSLLSVSLYILLRIYSMSRGRNWLLCSDIKRKPWCLILPITTANPIG